MRSTIRVALLGAALCLSVPVVAHQAVANYAAAVAAPDRPEDARKLDESRQPAKVLDFFGVKPGQTVADVMAGSGYYSELMAHVVGPKGKVIAYEPGQFYDNDAKEKAGWDALKGRNPNVSLVTYPFDKFAAPANSLDFTMLHMVYHDLYWESTKYNVPRTDPAAFLKTLYAATKPGGEVGVVDHVGPAGDTRATVDKFHRIDPAVVKADFKAAGFVLEAESDALHVAGDDHSKLVFDPAVRGKTDRFVYRFRKPK